MLKWKYPNTDHLIISELNLIHHKRLNRVLFRQRACLNTKSKSCAHATRYWASSFSCKSALRQQNHKTITMIITWLPFQPAWVAMSTGETIHASPSLPASSIGRHRWPSMPRKGSILCCSFLCWPKRGNRNPGIILWMRQANERQRYIVTSSLIGWHKMIPGNH